MKIKAIETNHAEVMRTAGNCKAALTAVGITPRTSLAEILRTLEIRVIHAKMPPLVEGLAAIDADIPEAGDGSSPRKWCIFVNDRFCNHRDSYKSAVMVQKVIVHELAHILQKHTPTYLRFRGHGQSMGVNKVVEALNSLLMDTEQRLEWETQAELFAAALTFKDAQRFNSIYYEKQADFRELAEAFTAPIDCAVKWALLIFHNFPTFYFKYNVRTKEIEDRQLIGDLRSEDVARLVLETAEAKNDLRRTITSISGEDFTFHSYYLPEDPHLDAPSKVIVTALSEAHRKLLKELYEEANKAQPKTATSKPATQKTASQKPKVVR